MQHILLHILIHFIKKIPNKRELKQITSNHSSDFINIILRNYFHFR